MAGGYLGKISAVVAANTGDYVRKLNDSASQTRAFAKTISSDLSRASREASRSIESILTPIQRVERALQNASSQGLSFRGFDGAIKTVEQLRRAIEKVADRPVELQFIIDKSGLETLEQIRQTIGSISEKNLQLAINVGGVDGLRKLRSEVQEVDGKLVNVKVETDATELDRLISVFSQISPERVRQLQIDVETRQVEQAVALNKQLVSVATDIAAAYGRAKQQFAGFANDVQVALGPGLKSTDSGLLQVLEDIENQIPITESRFADLKRSAQDALEAIGRVGEADRAAQSLSGGQNLSSRRGDVSRELDRAQASQQAGGGLSNAADLFARQKEAASALVVELGKMEAAELQIGGGVKVTTKEYERQLGVLRAITTQIEQSAAARGNADRANAVITGSPQNFDQGRSVQGQLETQVAALNRSQRQDFSGLLTQANDLSVGSRPENLEKYLDVLQKIQFLLGKTQRLNVDSEKAKSDADRLKKSLDTLRSDIRFRVTGDFQSIDQAKSAVESLAGRLGELGANQTASLQPQFDKVFSAIGAGDLAAAKKEFAELQSQFGSELQLKVDADDATAEFTSLRNSLKQVRDLAAFKITGQFQNLDQAKAAVDGVVQSLGKLGAQQAAGLGQQVGGAIKAIAASAAAPDDAALRKAALDAASNLESVFAKEYEIKVDADAATAEFQKLKTRREELSKDLNLSLQAAPEPVQGRFVGRATEIASTLTNPSATAADVDAAANATKKLKSEISAVTSQVNKFSGTFSDAFQASAIDSASAKLRILQQILIRAGVTSGEAVEKAEELAAEYEKAASSANGFLTRAKQIAAAEAAAVSSAQAATDARTGKGSVSVDRQFTRAGDVGRGGFDKLSLAAQQAAFAVDDFLSVTGGFDQKIRAVQNNLTQLAFVLGGTKGLFIGIGVAIASQAAIGLFKWINSGKTAEDQTKALNEALARQKSIVQELAQAFDSLGDSIARKAFSEGGEQASAFAKELDNIAKKQRELRESRVANLDPSVQAERATQNSLNRQLEGATDGGQRVAILRELEESRRREREAARAAASRPAPAAVDVGRSVLATIRENEFLVGGRLTAESARRAEERRAQAQQDFGAAGQDPRLLADIVDRRIQERDVVAKRDITADTLFSGEATEIVRAREDVAGLQRILESLRLPANVKADESIRSFLSEIDNAASAIQTAQSDVAEAIRAGIPSAVSLQAELDRFAIQINESQEAIRQANEDFTDSGGSAEAAAERDRIVSSERSRISRAEADRIRVIDSATALRQQRIVDPSTTSQARLERVRSNLSSLGIDNGPLASRLRAFEFQRQGAERRLTQAQRDGSSERQVQAIAGTLDALRRSEQGYDAATSAVRQFADALVRAGDRALQQAQQRRDAAVEADIAGGTDRTRFERQRAEEDVRAVEQATNRRNESLQRFIEQNQQNPEVQLLARFNEQLARGRTTTPQQDAASQQRIAELERQIAAGEAFAPPAATPAVDARVEQLAKINEEAKRLESQIGQIAQSAEVPFGPGVTFDDTLDGIRANAGEAVADEAAALRKRISELFKAAEGIGVQRIDFWEEGRKAAEEYAAATEAALESNKQKLDENAAALEANRKKLAELNAEIASRELSPEQRQRLEEARQATIRRIAENNQALQNDLQAPANVDALIQSRDRGEALVRQLTGVEAGEQLRQRLLDISRAGNVTDAQRQQAAQQARVEALTNVAPLLASFREQRLNALLQGPSRAALNVSDVTTAEGARELNRLLRGDDPAKDQNLIELQRQSQLLTELVQQGRAVQNPQIAN